RADVRRALDDPRGDRADRGARPGGRRADVARGGPRERPAPGRAAAVPAARARARERAGRHRGRLPRPLAMSDLLAMTAAQAADRVRAGELGSEELFAFYRERAAA